MPTENNPVLSQPEVKRWQLKGFIPGVEGESKAVFRPVVVLADDFDRIAAERDALQLRLNAADQRIDELTAQQAESRTITLSGCEFSEHELIGKAVRAVTGTSQRGTLRWVAMKDAFCCGSGVAHALCRRFGFDPDETLKP